MIQGQYIWRGETRYLVQPPEGNQLVLGDWDGSNTPLTWGIAQHPHTRLLFRQDLEHHVTGSLPCTVQCPALEGLQGTDGRDVNHSPAEARTVWKGLQDAGSQAEHRCQVQSPVAVHFSCVSYVNEAFGHIPKTAWKTIP